MAFNSFSFLVFFPVFFCVYYLVHACTNKKPNCTRFDNILLLLSSYILYILWTPSFIFSLLWCSLISYLSGIYIHNTTIARKKRILFINIILTIAPLIFFKYYVFGCTLLLDFISLWGINYSITSSSWLVPVGISFFTFQALSYQVDVYRGIEPERNILTYFLYMAFFPQITSGPISRGNQLLPQIKAHRPFVCSMALSGIDCLLWGCFLKSVVADRLSIYVDVIYSSVELYSGISCFFASILYTIQIYSDFAGYSLMSIGIGLLLGFRLPLNFNSPYFSETITEFWTRWHITLSRWLKDYIYIPLGGNRCSKGRNYLNIFITFLISGIWHGANMTFILWGCLHGLWQILEKKIGYAKYNSPNKVIKLLRVLFTFLIVNVLWVFFRSPDIHTAFVFLEKLFLLQEGFLFLPNNTQLITIILALSIFLIKEINNYRKKKNDYNMFSNNLYYRFAIWISLVSFILLFGLLDNGQFIYVSF